MSAFYRLPLATLKELQAAYIAAIKALAGSASYEMTDGVISRRLTRADLPDIKATLEEINAAIDFWEENSPRRSTYADFSHFDK
ncbi:MAG: hypothetical protein EHM23_26645 [Acidobacteria bacterium]|nr:MAG: hypothetical protein EHM23_26645 [Acidobacteriota bacterium]